MRRGILLAAGAGAYALALVVTAPATLLAPRLSDATAGRLRLVEPRGSVWSGSGIVEATDPKRRTVMSKRVSWRVAPAALLRGALGVDVTTSDSATPISIVATRGRIELERVRLTMPAAMLGLVAPKLASMQPLGNLELQFERLTIDGDDVSGSGIGLWQSAGSAVSNIYPLGSYEIRLETAGVERRAALRTLEGPLRLEGGASWRGGARPNAKTLAEVPAEHRETLAPLLRLIARERADGRFELDLP